MGRDGGEKMERGWLDSFEGEALWPTLPLPSAEQYEADLAARFAKLQLFLGEHARPGSGDGGEADSHRSAEGAVCVLGSPPRNFRARCRFALERDADGKFHYYLWNGAAGCATILGTDALCALQSCVSSEA